MIKKTTFILIGAVTLFSFLFSHLEKRETLCYNMDSVSRRIRQVRGQMEFSEFKDKAIYVPVGKNAITSASSTRFMIYSAPAQDCVLVTLYCESKQIGGIAHITIVQNPKVELNSLFGKFANKKVAINNLKARIIGGKAGLSEKTVSQIISILITNGVQIVEKDVLDNEPRTIVMDTQQGSNVFDVVGF